jgi:hypothetical protein
MGRIYHTIYYCGDIVGGEILVLGRFRRFVVNQVGKTPRLGGEMKNSPHQQLPLLPAVSLIYDALDATFTSAILVP